MPLLEIKQSARFLHDGTEDMQLNIESRKIKYNKKEELLSYSVSNAKIVRNSFGEKKIDKEKDISRIEITIHEGKNREVRKMCNAIGKKVLALHRSKIENIGVKDLKLGEWRYLTQKEVDALIQTNRK